MAEFAHEWRRNFATSATSVTGGYLAAALLRAGLQAEFSAYFGSRNGFPTFRSALTGLADGFQVLLVLKRLSDSQGKLRRQAFACRFDLLGERAKSADLRRNGDGP